MKAIFTLRRNSDSVERVLPHENEWRDAYLWADGNYSCDCNRHLFFERSSGNDPEVDSGTCGDQVAYSLRVTDADGKVLHCDGVFAT